MSLTDERKELEKNKDNLKAARVAINNKLVELGGAASTSFNDVPEKTTELANTITATNKTYIDNKTGDLANLQTQDKNNLVNAINEIKTGKANTTHKHNTSDITQDANNRFVTDTEKNKWNSAPQISDTTTTATSTWSSQKISTELNNAIPSDYEQVKADVEKLKTEVGTARTNLINSVNSTIDNL